MDGAESRDELLEQFAYLADELEAQRAVLALIPGPLVEVIPPGSSRSLFDLYSELAHERVVIDRAALAPWAGTGDARETRAVVASSLDELVVIAAAGRRDLATRLGRIPTEDWSVIHDDSTLADRVYDLIQQDTETLRTIAERLFEGGMRGRVASV